MKSYVTAIIAIVLMSITAQLHAAPTGHSPYGHTTVGMRLGWIGGPNGLTIRREIGNGHAFEFVGGYNAKYGRHADIPAIRKGNSFVGASYAPFFRMAEGNVGVSLLADIGMRLNYHHYRYIGTPNNGGKITPEATGGIGMQVEFSETVEVFADIHVKYFNEPHGDYVPGMDSGIGIRFAIN